MTIRWLGHSCFLIISEEGVKIITDPYTPGIAGGSVDYGPISIYADIVTISHEHSDHAYIEGLSGEFEVVSQPGDRVVKGVEIKGIRCYHDAELGAVRGRNIMFLIKVNRVRICHLGDLGHEIGPDEVEALGGVDILMIPVGGHYTIGPLEANRVVDRVNPKVVLPMHYQTDKSMRVPIAPADQFLMGKGNVRYLPTSEYSIIKEQLPERTEILVPTHEL